ncbi:MAG: RNA polymerase sigma-70 factor (ECF subfamily) [Planctomycetota bacterium]|jgi:RNA polymerase sigma-70 factor (ECF subfamily)
MRLKESQPAGACDPDTEARQIALARSGDLEAFDCLVRRHFARIYALLFRMIGNHEDAEDLAQECFIKAHKSLDRFQGKAAFSTWLYRIALHLSRDQYRRRQSAPQIALGFEGSELVSKAQGPQEQTSRKELMDGMRNSLERLPHRLRAALILRTQEGMEYEEIASVLGIGVQTARVHVMKARRQLEQWLREWCGEEQS